MDDTHTKSPTPEPKDNIEPNSIVYSHSVHTTAQQRHRHSPTSGSSTQIHMPIPQEQVEPLLLAVESPVKGTSSETELETKAKSPFLGRKLARSSQNLYEEVMMNGHAGKLGVASRPSSIISVDYPMGGSVTPEVQRVPSSLSLPPSTMESVKINEYEQKSSPFTSEVKSLEETSFEEFLLAFIPLPVQSLIYKPLHVVSQFVGTSFSQETMKIVILCLFWYGSSAMTNNIAKQLLNQYRFPVTLTYVQFAFVAVFCFFFGFWNTDYSRKSDNSHWMQNAWEKVLLYLRQVSRAAGPGSSTVHRLKYWFMVLLTAKLYIIVLFTRALQQSIMLIRYWLALGLGIDEDALGVTSNVTPGLKHSLPPNLRLCGSRIRIPTRDVVNTILPLSAFLISGHVFSSVAISNVPVSFVHTIKALSPLFTVLAYRLLYNTMYSSEVWISLVPLTLGVMLACTFELQFNVIGLACSLLSTFIFVAQNIFSKYLFGARKLDKLNMLLYSSSMSFILMTPIWFWSEGYKILVNSDGVHELPEHHTETPYEFISLFLESHPNLPSFSVTTLFILNGISHFSQNVFAFSILSLVTPVTYSIASLIKRIVVILISLIYFGQHVGGTQGFGIFLTFFGLWLYHRAKMTTVPDKQSVLPRHRQKISPEIQPGKPNPFSPAVQSQEEEVNFDVVKLTSRVGHQ